MLPVQAVFTTLIPGTKLSGSIGFPSFPSWFGKYSKQGRVDRVLQELQKHMRIHISANKIGVGMDYLSVLRDMLSKPLIKKGTDGVPNVIELMNEYSLTREDYDTIMELSTWPGQKDIMGAIDSKVKASFTRAYNKESHKNPFCTVSVKKLKPLKLGEGELEEDGENEEEEEENNDDITSDAMIKVSQKPKASAASKATAKTTTAAAKTAAKAPAKAPVKRGAKQTDDTEETKPKAKKKKT